MNEIEEAIEYFTKDMESFQCLVDNKLFPIELAEIYRNRNKAAIQALEKQIPKKPNRDINFNVMYCDCGARILPGQRFCSYCSQAMDWSGEE